MLEEIPNKSHFWPWQSNWNTFALLPTKKIKICKTTLGNKQCKTVILMRRETNELSPIIAPAFCLKAISGAHRRIQREHRGIQADHRTQRCKFMVSVGQFGFVQQSSIDCPIFSLASNLKFSVMTLSFY